MNTMPNIEELPESEDDSQKIDRFDKAILALFQRDTRLVSEAIGEAIGLSAASVQRRIKRLRSIGVIQNEIAKLDGHALGYPIRCIVGVDVEYERADQIDQFKKRMIGLPNVQQCYYVTGQWDFVLVVTARDMVDFEQFTRRVLLSDSNVRNFTTYVVMDDVKTGFSIPL